MPPTAFQIESLVQNKNHLQIKEQNISINTMNGGHIMLDFLNDYPELMNVHDVAGILGCSAKTIRQLCKTGKLRAMCIGKGWTIPQLSLKEFILIQSSFKDNYSNY